MSFGKNTIKEYMKVFKEKNVENIILGCTHYPIYDEIIREELGYKVNLINTGKCVANYLKNYLKENNINNNEKIGEKIFLSKPENEFKIIAKNILNENIEILNMK